MNKFNEFYVAFLGVIMHKSKASYPQSHIAYLIAYVKLTSLSTKTFNHDSFPCVVDGISCNHIHSPHISLSLLGIKYCSFYSYPMLFYVHLVCKELSALSERP